MWRTLNFRCPNGHEFSDLVRKDEAKTKCLVCGQLADACFTVCANTYIPPYHRAPGSVGSSSEFCERNKVWLGSEGHRKMREQDLRIGQRQEASQGSFEKFMKEKADNITEHQVMERANKIDEVNQAAASKARKVTVKAASEAA